MKNKPLQETITVNLNQAGKGDAPRNLGQKYRDNFDSIFRKPKQPQGAMGLIGHFVHSNNLF